MASKIPETLDKSRRLARHIESQDLEEARLLVNSLLPELDSLERLAQDKTVEISSEQVDSAAIELWNSLIFHSHFTTTTIRAKLCAAMLLSVHACLTQQSYTRALACALRTVESAIEFDECVRALEIADFCYGKVEQGEKNGYFMVKVVVAVRQREYRQAKEFWDEVSEMSRDESDRFAVMIHNICLDVDGEESVEWLMKASNVECSEQVWRNVNRVLVRKLDEDKAKEVVKGMVEKCPGSVDTYLANVELLEKYNATAAAEYEAMLELMVQNVQVTEENVSTVSWIYSHIGPKCNVLPSLDIILYAQFNDRLFIKRLHMSTDASNTTSHLSELCRTLKTNISSETLETGLVAVWKTASALKNDPRASLAWLQVGLHRVFDQASSANRAKFARRMMDIYIKLEETYNVLDLYIQLDEAAKSHPFTQCHMFKAYAHEKHIELASKCLDKIANSGDKNVAKLLGSCLSYANEMDFYELVSLGIQCILQLLETDGDVAALVRAAVQMAQPETPETPESNVLIVQVLERGITLIKSLKPDDLVWIGARCYNLSRKSLESGSLQFARLGCQYLEAALLYEKSPPQVQHYLIQLHLVQLYKLAEQATIEAARETQRISTKLRRIIGDSKNDITLRLVLYELSAAVLLDEPTDSLCHELIGSSGKQAECTVSLLLKGAMASDESSLRGISTVLQDQVMRHRTNTSSLAKWVRVFAGVALPHRGDLLMPLVARLLDLIKEGSCSSTHELRWIAVACWNRGVELMDEGDRHSSGQWCQVAIKLSGHVDTKFQHQFENMYLEMSTDK